MIELAHPFSMTRIVPAVSTWKTSLPVEECPGSQIRIFEWHFDAYDLLCLFVLYFTQRSQLSSAITLIALKLLLHTDRGERLVAGGQRTHGTPRNGTFSLLTPTARHSRACWFMTKKGMSGC